MSQDNCKNKNLILASTSQNSRIIVDKKYLQILKFEGDIQQNNNVCYSNIKSSSISLLYQKRKQKYKKLKIPFSENLQTKSRKNHARNRRLQKLFYQNTEACKNNKLVMNEVLSDSDNLYSLCFGKRFKKKFPRRTIPNMINQQANYMRYLIEQLWTPLRSNIKISKKRKLKKSNKQLNEI